MSYALLQAHQFSLERRTNCQPLAARPLVTSAVELHTAATKLDIRMCLAADPLPASQGLQLRSEISLVCLGGNCPGLDLGGCSFQPCYCLIMFLCFQWRGVVREKEENHESLYYESE